MFWICFVFSVLSLSMDCYVFVALCMYSLLFFYIFLLLLFFVFSVYIFYFFFLMIRRPPRSTRTDTLFPYTTLFRSQVFRGMDIGTGKDLEEYGFTPHFLIDIREAGEEYNVAAYREDFLRALEQIRATGKLPIL